jgi:hypothetical protein
MAVEGSHVAGKEKGKSHYTDTCKDFTFGCVSTVHGWIKVVGLLTFAQNIWYILARPRKMKTDVIIVSYVSHEVSRL